MSDRWSFTDLDSMRKAFFADAPQPTDPAGWLTAEHRFAEHLANATPQWSPHWDNFDMDSELRDRRNAGEIARFNHPQDRAHLAYNDPASALRRIAAERDLLVEHSESNGDCSTCVDGGWGWPVYSTCTSQRWPCRTVLGLAKAWGWEQP